MLGSPYIIVPYYYNIIADTIPLIFIIPQRIVRISNCNPKVHLDRLIIFLRKAAVCSLLLHK